jgi:hypothetical protein
MILYAEATTIQIYAVVRRKGLETRNTAREV